MRLFIIVIPLLVASVMAGEDTQQKGYEAQWKNEMRLYGTHPDTVQMFLDAPSGLPVNDTTGLPVLGSTSKKISSDGQRGWLWIVERAADVKTSNVKPNGHHYWSYAIRPVLVFDLTKGQKK
jgi:hypothetical protein